MVNFLKSIALKALGVIGEYLKYIFIRGIHKQLEVIIPLAYDVVKAVQNDPSLVTNSEKREKALQLLKEELAKRSLDAATSTVAMAIELAVQRLKVEG